MTAQSRSERQSGYRVREWGRDPEWEEFLLPSLGPGEAMIQVGACGVGLTVLNCINGDLDDDPSLLPRVPGHEIAGRVVAVAEDGTEDLVGRAVVAYFYLSCGVCAECRAGRDSRCRSLGGWVGVHRDGGYAPFTVLPVANLVEIPDDLDPVAATVVPDAVATPVHVAGRAGIGPEDRVVVLGAGGGVGIHMIQVAAARGAEVAGLDVTSEKLEEVERLGARAVDSSDFSRLASPFGSSFPTVVVDLLGSVEAARWGIDVLDPGGRLIALTTFRDRPVPVEARELVFGEISLVGSRYATKEEVSRAARMVADGSVTPVIGAVGGPSQVPDMHDRLRSRRLVGRGALDWRLDD